MTKLFVSLASMFIIIMVSAIGILPLEVHIIRDIAQLYKIDYVVNLPNEVIFGILLLIGLFKIKIKKDDLFNKKEDKDEDEWGVISSIKSLIQMAMLVIILLMSWWVAYIVHSVNHF